MNKLLTIIIFLAMTGLVSASDITDIKYKEYLYNLNKINESSAANTYESLGNGNSTLDLSGRDIAIQERFYWNHFRATTPFDYDPATGAIGIALTKRIWNGSTFNGSNAYLLRSTNNGNSWDSTQVYRNFQEANPFNPSFKYLNASKSSNLEDLNYVFVSHQTIKPNPDPTGDPYLYPNGLIFSIYDKSFGTEPLHLLETAPEEGNPPHNQDWNDLRMGSDENLNTIYGFGTLQGRNPVVDQFGYYGFWSFDFNAQANFGIIPSQWWANKFRESPAIGSTFNGIMEVVTDPNGTFFAAVNNRHFENAEPRLLGISKSTNQGQTWSSFELMDLSILNSILDNYPGYTALSILSPYTKNAMFSRGVNKVSYISTVILQGEDMESLGFIVEMTYDDGVFGIKQLSELESDAPKTLYQDGSTFDNTSAYKAFMLNSRFGNNFQVAKTVDGSKLVMFWIDAVPDKVIKFAPVSIRESQFNSALQGFEEVDAIVDSVLQYDIFASVYDMGDGSWTTPVNITNDDSTETYFNIPKVVPSINRVPILTYKGVNNSTINVANLPPQLVQMQIDGTVLIRYSEIDATKTQDPISSVKELKFNVELGNAYPNPAVNTNTVSISFDIEKLSDVSLEMYDQIGNKVATILNNQVTSGSKSLNADISNLNTGTYYYQLSVNGHTFTKKLVVVK